MSSGTPPVGTTSEAPPLTFVDPQSGAPLSFRGMDDDASADGVWQAEEGGAWPQLDGIAYLRAGREELAGEAVELLRSDRREEALALLLTDTDAFAPAAPDRRTALGVVRDVRSGDCPAIEAMRRLGFGPVADYFAVRPSTPTFVSGLELLARHVESGDHVVELACGLGHFLNHLSRHGVRCAGSDVTFSKLWLGRRFLVPTSVPLVCADIVAGDTFVLRGPARATVLCHDAFYFLPDKARAARRLESLAGTSGKVLLGHVHLAGFDHGGIAGELSSAEGYARLFKSIIEVHEDAALVRDHASGRATSGVPPHALDGCEAMALVAGRTSGGTPLAALRHAPPGELLYANPLLTPDSQGVLRARWPSEAFSREYRDAGPLGGTAALEPGAMPCAAERLSPGQRTRRIGLPADFVRVANAPLRWAIAGCGWVTRDYVAPAFADTPSARLVALCDTDPSTFEDIVPAGNAGDGARGPRGYTDHRAMLREQNLDSLYIATPNDAHATLCIDAARAGLDVMCEKPIAATLADAQAMLGACESAGVVYATAFDQRFHEAHQRLRDGVRDGSLGPVAQARVHYACQVDADWRPGGRDIDNWRLDRARAGGGAVIDLAPHAIDLLSFVLDDEPLAVDVRLQPRLLGTPSDVDAGGVLGVEFSRGCLASVHVSYQCPEFLPRREIELIGTTGGAIAIETMGQTPGGRIDWRRAEGTRTETFSRAPALSPFARQIEAFSAARLQDRPWPFTPARDLAHFAMLLDAIDRSAYVVDGARGSRADRSSVPGRALAEPATET